MIKKKEVGFILVQIEEEEPAKNIYFIIKFN